MKRNKQSKVVNLDKGLVIVRYLTAEDINRPPKVKVLVNPTDEKQIEIISNPLYSKPVLWQPGACLVVRAMQRGKLLVEVIPIDPDGSTTATVAVEVLSQGEISEPELLSGTTKAVLGLEHSADLDRNFKVIGHVAGIGDVTAQAGEWVAGPSAPARIEGLSIVWPNKPDDLDICYCVKLARPHAASERMTRLGAYAGTRGRALPIVGITLELSGPVASRFWFVAEAAFLGAPMARTNGKLIEMAGPTGREPLVGFRLRLDKLDAPLQPVLRQAETMKAQGRPRVFRSQATESRIHSAEADAVAE